MNLGSIYKHTVATYITTCMQYINLLLQSCIILTMMVYYRSSCYGYVIIYPSYVEAGRYLYFCGTHNFYALTIPRRFGYIKYVPGSFLYWYLHNGFSYATYTAEG